MHYPIHDASSWIILHHYDHVIDTNSLHASAEGRVEHQNFNQTAALLS